MKITNTNYRSRGKTYPEQSTRQALRGSRRQQGGPGIPATLSAGIAAVAKAGAEIAEEQKFIDSLPDAA